MCQAFRRILFVSIINMITLIPVYSFAIFLQLNVVVGIFCNDKNCKDCASNTFLGKTCRWCRRDNKCHVAGSPTTKCKRAENIVDPSRCGEELPQYNPELSLKMLLLSAAAYDPNHPQKCLDNSLPNDDFQIQHTVTKKCDFLDNQCSGYVAFSHTLNVIVIAFRGSECFEQAFIEFVEGLVSPKETFLNDGEVQTYWKRGFEKLWPSMGSKVKDLIRKYQSSKIWVTGHSLGGAMASLASAWLRYYNVASRDKIVSYTFGMPRVGNYDYALQHDQLVSNSWRVVNKDDAVPHFPSLASLTIINGPYHHGVEAFYSEPATSVYSKHRECHGRPFNEDATCSFSELPPSFERHKNYFGIPVGTFWEKGCVHSTRKKRETPGKYNNTLARDPRCSKKNTKEARSSSARARFSKMSQFERSLFCFVVFFFSTALE